MFKRACGRHCLGKGASTPLFLICLSLLLFISTVAQAVNCPLGYHYDRKSANCIQSDCFDIPHAHYTPGGQCVCGSSGSMMENPSDPNKECILPKNPSCQGCVYACVGLNDLCPHEKTKVVPQSQAGSKLDCARKCREQGPNFIAKEYNGRCDCICADGYELDPKRYECVMKAADCDRACKEYHGTSKIHGPEAKGRVINGVCQCFCRPGYKPDDTLTCVPTPYCPDGKCDVLDDEDCSWCEDCACDVYSVCRPDSLEALENFPSDGCVEQVAQLVEFGCTRGGTHRLKLKKIGTNKWVDAKHNEVLANGDLLQLNSISCSPNGTAFAVFRWERDRWSTLGKALLGSNQLYGEVRIGRSRYRSGWKTGALMGKIGSGLKEYFGSDWLSIAWNIITIKPGWTLALQAFKGKAGEPRIIYITFRGTNIIIEPDGQGGLRFVTLEGLIDLHDQDGNLIATIPEGKETTLDQALRSARVQNYDPASINPLWQENWPAGLDGEPRTDAVTGGCDGMVGIWRWFNGATVTCKAEGSCDATNGFSGPWTCLDPSGRYEVRWGRPNNPALFIDTLELSPDGKQLRGTNQFGVGVMATRQ
ncbi:MAG: hypothetical protein KAT62_14155 [Desulfuromonadales bacterium]|nr:hypothetical protein [Desulfuromonadales bacterium]